MIGKRFLIEDRGLRHPCIVLEDGDRLLTVGAISDGGKKVLGQIVTVRTVTNVDVTDIYTFDDLVVDGEAITGLKASLEMYLKAKPGDDSISDALDAVGLDETALLPR